MSRRHERCPIRRQRVVSAANAPLWYGRALVQDARRKVSAALPVVCGLLALAFALPAAGDPRQDTGQVPPASAAARVQATLAELAAREAALDNASRRATVQLHVARRILVVA